MGLFDIGEDWGSVEAPEFEDIPAGIYEAEVTAIDQWQDKETERKAFTFDYMITGDDAHDDKYVGRTKREFKFFTDDSGAVDMKGLGFVKARLINLGVPEDANFNTLDTDDLIGTPVAVTIVARAGTGKNAGTTFYNVTRVQRIGGEAAPAAANKPAPAAAAAPATETDEDNPFA